MSNIYVSYKCRSCKNTIILLNDEMLSTIAKGKYLVCSHCSSRRLVLESSTNDLRECMQGVRTYKKVKGKWREVR
ncbi:MAG: hypothetical protein E7I48_10000 [Clostridium celatum]|nr:hypothetical protein [Clostridium celatum]